MKIDLRPIAEADAKPTYEMFQYMSDSNGNNHEMYGKSMDDFVQWIKSAVDGSKGLGLKEGYVPYTILILWVDDVPVGWTSFRHELTPALEKLGGHIGYGVSSQYRGKGYASIMLSEVLKYIKDNTKLKKVLITIDDDNPASWKTTERNGGILEKNIMLPDRNKLHRYYWITI